MKITILKTIPLWVLIFVAFSFAPLLAENTADTIRRGDLAFNQGQYNEALKHYQKACVQLEKAPPTPLFGEVINNMAAVYMAQGNLKRFYRNFQLARKMKQQYAGIIAHKRTEHNLLVNGGFEDGLIFPWGTGHYERTDGKFKFGVWWNSKNAKAFMKMDRAQKYAGKQSLRITNYSPAAPHIFTTLSQRISGLEPNSIYKISCYVKAQDFIKKSLFFTVDPGWQKRSVKPRAGTYDWELFSGTVNIGHNDYIDLRIVLENTGTLWLDEIRVEKATACEKPDSFQQAESLFDLAKYEEALQAFSKLHEQHPKNRKVTLYMGRIHLILAEYGRAFEKLNKLVNQGYVQAAVYLGELYYHLGDYDTAEHLLKQSVGSMKGNQAGISLAMNNLSRIYLAKGDLKNASACRRTSLRSFRHIGDKHGQALALNQLGIMHQLGKEYDLAETSFVKAYQLVEQLGDEKMRSDIVLNLAQTAYLNKQPDKARRYVAQGLKIKQGIIDQLGRIRGLHLKARLETQEKNFDTALENYRAAVSLLESVSTGIEGISREAKTTFVKQFSKLNREYAELLLQFYQQTKKSKYHQEAFRVSEQARSRVFTEMITEARAMKAFAGTSTDGAFSQLLKTEQECNAKIHALATQIQKLKTGADPRKVHLFEQRLANVRQQHRNIQSRLKQDYPRYVDLKKPKPVRIKDVKSLLMPDEVVLSYFVMPGCTALWAISQEKCDCFIIPSARRELFKQSKLFYGAFKAIADEISQFDPIFGPADQKDRLRSAFSRYNPNAASDLYAKLVAPAEPVFHDKRIVYLILDDFLYKLPFEALLTQPFRYTHRQNTVMGEGLRNAPFWVKTHTVSYLPSICVLRSLRTLKKEYQGHQKPFIAFADPVFTSDSEQQNGHAVTRSAYLRKAPAPSGETSWELPPLSETRDEALEVAEIMGASPEQDVYLQKRAIEQNVKKLPLDRYSTVLFATHALLAGEFGPGTPPALALSFVGDRENDGLLEMGEILGLNLNAQLVVLSACNTAGGSGKDDHGEGFAGLTRSFMYAGAKSLFVTQWSVESSSARILVRNTFRQIQGRSKGDALALSKREMINSEQVLQIDKDLSVCLAHPYFWAPYILVGEAK